MYMYTSNMYSIFCMLFCICTYYANGHNSDRRDGMKSNMQGIGGGSGDFGSGSGTIYTLYMIVLYVYICIVFIYMTHAFVYVCYIGGSYSDHGPAPSFPSPATPTAPVGATPAGITRAVKGTYVSTV